MTHLPYIVASYGLFLIVAAGLAAASAARLRGAVRRLRAVDPRE